MKLKCRHNHKPSGRVFLVSTRDSINDFITWGKYCYIPFIVLANSLFIWGPTIEFSLMRLILPSFSFRTIFYPSMAFAQEGTVFPCSYRVQNSVSAPAWSSHRPNHKIVSNFDSFYYLLFQFIYFLRYP